MGKETSSAEAANCDTYHRGRERVKKKKVPMVRRVVTSAEAATAAGECRKGGGLFPSGPTPPPFSIDPVSRQHRYSPGPPHAITGRAVAVARRAASLGDKLLARA